MLEEAYRASHLYCLPFLQVVRHGLEFGVWSAQLGRHLAIGREHRAPEKLRKLAARMVITTRRSPLLSA